MPKNSFCIQFCNLPSFFISLLHILRSQVPPPSSPYQDRKSVRNWGVSAYAILFQSPDRHTSHFFYKQLTYHIINRPQPTTRIPVYQSRTDYALNTHQLLQKRSKNIAVKLHHLAIPKVRFVYTACSQYTSDVSQPSPTPDGVSTPLVTIPYNELEMG